jgi:DNA-binding NarL/FixJ family response regulator
MSIQCVIVEDDEVVAEYLREMIETSEGISFVGHVKTESEALAKIPAWGPEVVLMDIKLRQGNGIDCIRKLKPDLPLTNFLVITVFEESDTVLESLKAGATGYILKTSTPEQYIEAIRIIAAGGSPLSPAVARKLIGYFGPTNSNTKAQFDLTQREREIVELLANGMMYKEVASHLGISMDTVRTHVRHIYEKLRVRSRTEAVNKLFPRS